MKMHIHGQLRKYFDLMASIVRRVLDKYEFSEKDFKNAIIKNLKDFILEVGKDFTFIGDEYRVQV